MVSLKVREKKKKSPRKKYSRKLCAFSFGILKNPSDGRFRVTFSSIWMLLDNVYRAQSPKAASFFTLNKTFNLIKRDVVGFSLLPASWFAKKKSPQNPSQIMVRYVCL